MPIARFKPVRSLYRKTTRLLNKTENKLYQVSAKRRREHSLYLADAQLYTWFCRQPWFQRRYWAGEVKQIQRFLCETAILKLNPTLDGKQIIQQALLGHYLRERWKDRFTGLQPKQVASIFTVHGQEVLAAAAQQKKGVFLALTHAYATHLVRPWLVASRKEPELTIQSAAKAAQRMGIPFSRATSQFIYGRQLYEAKECLQQKGIVSILADGFQGGEGISLPFYQLVRSFRTSFAELALRTGAVILPVSARLDLHGRVELIFHPAMQLCTTQLSHNEQVEQLVKQYATFLQAEWAQAPGNIPIPFMGKYLDSLAQIVDQEHESDVE